MASHLAAFRLPKATLDRVDKFALALHVPRTSILLEATRLFICKIREREGYIIPPYSDRNLAAKLQFRATKGADDADGGTAPPATKRKARKPRPSQP